MFETLNVKSAVNLGGTNKIIHRQAIDTVGAELNTTGIVCNGHLWMMVLLVRHHGNDINEGHGVVIVFELEGAANGLAVFSKLPLRGDLL